MSDVKFVFNWNISEASLTDIKKFVEKEFSMVAIFNPKDDTPLKGSLGLTGQEMTDEMGTGSYYPDSVSNLCVTERIYKIFKLFEYENQELKNRVSALEKLSK